MGPLGLASDSEPPSTLTFEGSGLWRIDVEVVDSQLALVVSSLSCLSEDFGSTWFGSSSLKFALLAFREDRAGTGFCGVASS